MNVCDFGTILKQLRKSHNLTQKELGFQFGVKKSKTLDISTLNETQIDTVRRVIAEFNKSNRT